MGKGSIIRTIYFYLVTLIGLLMIVIPVGSLIDIGLKTWVFPNVTEYYYDCVRSTPRPVTPESESTPLTPEETEAQCEKNRIVAKENEVRQRQSRAIRDISFLIVGIPLFLFHFRVVQRERREGNQ